MSFSLCQPESALASSLHHCFWLGSFTHNVAAKYDFNAYEQRKAMSSHSWYSSKGRQPKIFQVTIDYCFALFKRQARKWTPLKAWACISPCYSSSCRWIEQQVAPTQKCTTGSQNSVSVSDLLQACETGQIGETFEPCEGCVEEVMPNCFLVHIHSFAYMCRPLGRVCISQNS